MAVLFELVLLLETFLGVTSARSASLVNAANLGSPIAASVRGDAALAAPAARLDSDHGALSRVLEPSLALVVGHS